jgi:uroporphyrinogen-III decarboxylase
MAGWGCASIEAHALGSVWSWKDPFYPKINQYRLNDPNDLEELVVPDPFEDSMMFSCIEGLKLMKKKYGDTVPILGFVNGPLLAAEELRGCEKLLIDMVINPNLYNKILDLQTKTNIRYVEAMIKEADVHGIFIEDGSLGADQLSKEQAIGFNLKYTERLAKEIKKRNKWLVIHNCSKEPYLDLHASLKPDIVDYWIKAGINSSKVKEYLRKICISTGVDAFKDTILAKPEEIEKTVIRAFEEYGKNGGFMIGAGCEIPFSAPIENIWAIKRAAINCGKRMHNGS